MDRQNVLRVIGISACALFIVSISLPFLQAHYSDVVGMYHRNVVLWSFKENYEMQYLISGGVMRMGELWFADYWSGFWQHRLAWVEPFLIFTFEAQVFTILFAVLAVLKVRSYLFLSSTILNIFTIFCIKFIEHTLKYEYYGVIFQAGFWFTLPSATLFFTAFFLSWRWCKVKIANTPIPFLQQNDKGHS